MGLEPLAWSAKPRLDTVLSTRQLPMVVAGLLFVCSTGLALVNGWQAEAVIALVLSTLVVAPWLVERWSDVKIPINMQIQYGMLIVTGPYLGGYWGWYDAWPPWDTLVHFYSGFFISFVLGVVLGKTLHTYRLNFPVWLEMVTLITVKAFIALLWEIAEFVFDLMFGTSAQGDNLDTMTDMIAALIPSILIAIALYTYRRKGTFTYIGSLLDAGRGM